MTARTAVAVDPERYPVRRLPVGRDGVGLVYPARPDHLDAGALARRPVRPRRAVAGVAG